MHDVSAYLATLGINVEAMETEIVAAPLSVTPLFRMEAELVVPRAPTLDEQRKHLMLIGDQLDVGIEILPAEKRC